MIRRIVMMLPVVSLLMSNINLYWDLGLGVTNFPVRAGNEDFIKLSTFNRIEGLKKYYNNDFEGAIYHFSQLNYLQQDYIVYEYAHAYYELNQFETALELLNIFPEDLMTENIIYLKSKILTTLGDYDAALTNLQLLTQDFPDSDYARIIQFDIEKINLLSR